MLRASRWRTSADPDRLENVVLNLAINARDARPGGGRMTIETQNAHPEPRYVPAEPGVIEHHYVLIAVTDTGIGMPDEAIAKVFKPVSTTKGGCKGTGFGLSAVYGVVKQIGGDVRICSAGEGTTIKVYLKRVIGQPFTVEELAADVRICSMWR